MSLKIKGTTSEIVLGPPADPGAPDEAPLPFPWFIADRCLSNSYPTLRTRAYFSLNALPRSRRGYISLGLQTAQLTFPRHHERHGPLRGVFHILRRFTAGKRHHQGGDCFYILRRMQDLRRCCTLWGRCKNL